MTVRFNALLLRGFVCAQCRGATVEIDDYRGRRVVCGRDHDHGGFWRESTVELRKRQSFIEGIELQRVLPDLSGFTEPTQTELDRHFRDLFGGGAMPIKGMTDQAPSFPQIGVIRKGAPKPKDAKRPGADLKHFRVVFDEEETEAAEMFANTYGPTPAEINILIPFDEIDRNWEAWREAYVAGAMIHRCDGEHVVYALDPKTGEVLVHSGRSVEAHQPVACDGLAKCKPSGRLRVIVPELQRLAYLMVLTTSIHDIVNISKHLAAIKELNGGQLRGLPLMLRRRPKMISTPSGPNGKRARREKWLMSIEADPKWVAAKLREFGAASFPALPANWDDERDFDDSLDAEYTETEDTEYESGAEAGLDNGNGEEEGESPREQPNGASPRPWQPEVLKRKMLLSVSSKAGMTGNPSPDQIGLLAGMLEEAWPGDKRAVDNRHEVLGWLTGKRSVRGLGLPWIATLLKWLLEGKDESGNYQFCEHARQEARLVYKRVMLDQGQQQMPLNGKAKKKRQGALC